MKNSHPTTPMFLFHPLEDKKILENTFRIFLVENKYWGGGEENVSKLIRLENKSKKWWIKNIENKSIYWTASLPTPACSEKFWKTFLRIF
jgi:hypothetical protein